MREENGIRYYEEGEKIMTTMEWRKGLTCSRMRLHMILTQA